MTGEALCPRCGNGKPCCADTKPDGSHYSHADTCATYTWATSLCAPCEAIEAADGG